MTTRKQQKRIMLRRSDSAIKKEILESLIFNGPLKLTHIDCIASVNCNKLKKFRTSNIGGIVVVIIIFMSFIICTPLLIEASVPIWLSATLLNALILFAGMSFSGNKSVWIPRALDIKAAVVQRMHSSPTLQKDTSITFVPYLEMGKGKA